MIHGDLYQGLYTFTRLEGEGFSNGQHGVWWTTDTGAGPSTVRKPPAERLALTVQELASDPPPGSELRVPDASGMVTPPAAPRPPAVVPAVRTDRPKPPARRTLRLGVWARRAAAVGALTTALWWLALPLAYPVAHQAVVNARVVQVRAPIDGTTTELCRDLSDLVDAGQPLLRITNTHVDTSYLERLKTRRAELAAARARLASGLDEAIRDESESRSTAQRFRAALIKSLKSSLEEATALAQAAKSEAESAKRRSEEARRLVSQRLASVVELDANRERAEVTGRMAEQAEASRARLAGELEAAGQGLFLQKDDSYHVRRADELAAEIMRLRAQLRENAELLAATDSELHGEEQHLAKLARATSVSPRPGAVWKVQGVIGQAVRQNEVIYEIADRDSVFVEALLNQRHLRSVTPGCRATINVTGGRTLTGRVRAVRTPDPSEDETAFALRLPDADLKKVRVLIDVDPADRDAALIGRHAQVLISGTTPGPFPRAITWLFSKLRG